MADDKKDTKTGGSYDASDISVLEGLEPVRRRPGMYIGTTGPEGLHHLVWEIFDNSRDEAIGGFCDDIEVVLLPGNRIRVADNGRGEIGRASWWGRGEILGVGAFFKK